MNTPVIQPTVAELATVAAVEAITESKQEEKETPCAPKDKECTRRWIDSISDCC